MVEEYNFPWENGEKLNNEFQLVSSREIEKSQVRNKPLADYTDFKHWRNPSLL